MQSKKILVVDDELELCRTVRYLLMSEGCEIDTFQTAAEARESLFKSIELRSPYDLIITDIVMPSETGLDFIKSYRSKGIDIPTLVMTGYGDKPLLIELLRLRVSDYIDKPFQGTQFVQSVKGIFSRQDEDLQSETNKNVQTSLYEKSLKELTTIRDGSKVSHQPSSEDNITETTIFVKIAGSDGVMVINFPSEIDVSIYEIFRTLLIDVLKDGGKIKFNLERVTNIDSISLSLLFHFGRAWNSPSQNYPKIVLLNTKPDIKNLFSQTRLHEFFEIA